MKKVNENRKAKVKSFLKLGFSQKEIDEYFSNKDAKAKKKADAKKQDKKRKPIIFYGYNTVTK